VKSILVLVVFIPLQLPGLLRILPLVSKILLPLHDAVLSSLVPVGLTGDRLPPRLIYEPQLLEDVDVVALEAVAGSDVSPLPGLLERPPHLLGVTLPVLQQVVPDEEAGGINEG